MAKKNAVMMADWLNKHSGESNFSPGKYAIDELSRNVEETLVNLLAAKLDCECPIGQCGGKFPDPDGIPDKLLDDYLSPCPYCGVSPWGAGEEKEEKQTTPESIEDFPTEDEEEKSEEKSGDIDSELDGEPDEDPFEDTEKSEEPEPEPEPDTMSVTQGGPDADKKLTLPCTPEMFDEYMRGVQENVTNFFVPLMGDKYDVEVSLKILQKITVPTD